MNDATPPTSQPSDGGKADIGQRDLTRRIRRVAEVEDI